MSEEVDGKKAETADLYHAQVNMRELEIRGGKIYQG